MHGGPAEHVAGIGKQGTLYQGGINYRLQEYHESSATGLFMLMHRALSSHLPLNTVLRPFIPCFDFQCKKNNVMCKN